MPINLRCSLYRAQTLVKKTADVSVFILGSQLVTGETMASSLIQKMFEDFKARGGIQPAAGTAAA